MQNKKIKRVLFNTLVIMFMSLWMSAAMCTKVVTYARDYHTQALSHRYPSNIPITLQQAQKALEGLGYAILRVDESRNQIITGWRPTRSDSHYLELFKRKDYSANAGAYYQLVVDVFEDGPKIKVSTHTIVKSISGDLKSSYVLEKMFLTRLDDQMRSPQIEMTNVGVKQR